MGTEVQTAAETVLEIEVQTEVQTDAVTEVDTEVASARVEASGMEWSGVGSEMETGGESAVAST